MFTTNELEQSKIALMNVSYYDSITEYMTQLYIDIDTQDEAEQSFRDDLEQGYIQQITLGTYNGALDTTDYRAIDKVHILDSIATEVNETEFDTLMFDEDKTKFKEYTQMDWIREYTELYDVFIIDKHIYVKID